MNGNVSISLKISQKFVTKGPINNIPELVYKMYWRRPTNQWWLVYRRIYVSLRLSELNDKPNLVSVPLTDAYHLPMDKFIIVFINYLWP